jgi:hypothetical protein
MSRKSRSKTQMSHRVRLHPHGVTVTAESNTKRFRLRQFAPCQNQSLIQRSFQHHRAIVREIRPSTQGVQTSPTLFASTSLRPAFIRRPGTHAENHSHQAHPDLLSDTESTPTPKMRWTQTGVAANWELKRSLAENTGAVTNRDDGP